MPVHGYNKVLIIQAHYPFFFFFSRIGFNLFMHNIYFLKIGLKTILLENDP